MSKSAKTFIIVLILVVAAVAGIYIAKRTSNNNAVTTNNNDSSDADQTPEFTTDLIFFYGATCPHCKVVEDFFDTNKVTKKVKFEQKEVYTIRENAGLMTEKQTLCKDLSEDNKGGVPFLYGDNGNVCLVGSDQIIDYFKQRFNI